jgi:hypothetical protein
MPVAAALAYEAMSTPRAADQHIRTGAALEHVVRIAAIQHVIARAA